MMKRLLTCFLICFGLSAVAQDYTSLAVIHEEAHLTAIDQLGNVYVVNKDNDLIKYNVSGKKESVYSNTTFGNIEQLDVKDPLRVVLYYPMYQQIVVLSNQLTEISKYSFNNRSDSQITLVCSANNNGYWIYDQLNRELRKLSNSFSDLVNTKSLFQRNGLDMNAVYLDSNDEYVFINDKGAGIRIFDRFGNYFKVAVAAVDREFSVEGSKIYFTADHKLCSYDFRTFELQEIKTPDRVGVIKFQKHQNHLLIIGEKELTLWSLIQK
ncbi:hypothetical protein [Pseudopedobacter beijingensis]|uniref:Uncharacterized protein n=1 Tax=Pseudopedobacter beijingensis TaxID=1207056 RepID=A0ABW4IAZ0_9SPHI